MNRKDFQNRGFTRVFIMKRESKTTKKKIQRKPTKIKRENDVKQQKDSNFILYIKFLLRSNVNYNTKEKKNKDSYTSITN